MATLWSFLTGSNSWRSHSPTVGRLFNHSYHAPYLLSKAGSVEQLRGTLGRAQPFADCGIYPLDNLPPRYHNARTRDDRLSDHLDKFAVLPNHAAPTAAPFCP